MYCCYECSLFQCFKLFYAWIPILNGWWMWTNMAGDQPEVQVQNHWKLLGMMNPQNWQDHHLFSVVSCPRLVHFIVGNPSPAQSSYANFTYRQLWAHLLDVPYARVNVCWWILSLFMSNCLAGVILSFCCKPLVTCPYNSMIATRRERGFGVQPFYGVRLFLTPFSIPHAAYGIRRSDACQRH